jgi:hypothetical protein
VQVVGLIDDKFELKGAVLNEGAQYGWLETDLVVM